MVFPTCREVSTCGHAHTGPGLTVINMSEYTHVPNALWPLLQFNYDLRWYSRSHYYTYTGGTRSRGEPAKINVVKIVKNAESIIHFTSRGSLDKPPRETGCCCRHGQLCRGAQPRQDAGEPAVVYQVGQPCQPVGRRASSIPMVETLT